MHGYEEWGAEGLARRIAGDYAFGLWDTGRRRLTLLRDRIGVKPSVSRLGPRLRGLRVRNKGASRAALAGA